MTNDEERTKVTVHYDIMLPNAIKVCGTEMKLEQEDFGYSYKGSIMNRDVKIDCMGDGSLGAYINGKGVLFAEITPTNDVDDVMNDTLGFIEKCLLR